MIDFIICGISTLFESESRERETPVLSGHDFVQIDGTHFPLVNSFLYLEG